MKEKVAERILHLIEIHNINRNKLAVATGISSGLIFDWTMANKSPSLKNAIKVAQYFGVSLDYLVGLKDTPD